MNLLLDTHVLLLARGVPRRPAQDVQAPVKDEDHKPVQ